MNLKVMVRFLLVLLFGVAGVLHFTHDVELAAIVPPLLPFKLEIVWFTGILEFLFALALLQNRYLPQAGMVIALFCLAVLPANIYMAMAGIPLFTDHIEPWILWLRIPMQFPLIALILWSTGFSFSSLRH